MKDFSKGAVGALALSALMTIAQPTLADELFKTSIVLSTTDQDVSYQPYGPFAQQMGWYADEGLDVTIETAPNTGQVLQSVLSGQADFAMTGPDALILAAKDQDLPLEMVYIIIRKMIYTAAVLPDAGIDSFEDMPGKVIGFPAFSSTLTSYVENRLAEFDLSIDQVQQVETGYGVSSMEALKDGTIDGFIAWPGLFAAFRNAGYDFDLLPEAPWQTNYYGIGLAARKDFIAENPEVVQSIARGLAMSAVYLKANPEKIVDEFWKAYPSRAPLPGEDEALAMEKELRILAADDDQMRISELPLDFMWGSQSMEIWQNHVDLLSDTGQIEVKPDPQDFFTDAFNAYANDFDKDALLSEAKGM